jgi:hypothetical protein
MSFNFYSFLLVNNWLASPSLRYNQLTALQTRHWFETNNSTFDGGRGTKCVITNTYREDPGFFRTRRGCRGIWDTFLFDLFNEGVWR